MSKPVIAIDMDDVLVRATESLRRKINARLGIELSVADYAVPGEYSQYYDRVWQAHGIADRISWGELDAEMVDDQSHMLPMKQALMVLRLLAKNYGLVIVTARNVSWEAATRRWLDSNYPDVFRAVHFAGHRMHPKTKGELCKQLGAEWLIDDNPEHCETALAIGIQAILFGEYGWHKHRAMPKQAIVCRDWQAVQEYFNGEQ